VNETGELRANDTDGFVLKAQPGKSQRRPLKSSGSKPIAQIGLPNMRSPKAPEPSRPSLNPHQPDQQPQHDILMPEKEQRRLFVELVGRGLVLAGVRDAAPSARLWQRPECSSSRKPTTGAVGKRCARE